jgi:hypothetical protein
MSDSLAPDAKNNLIQSIREWFSVCDSQHRETCTQPCLATAINAPQSARPSWVIDVEEQCIVPGNIEAEYLALSYTWQADTEDVTESSFDIKYFADKNFDDMEEFNGTEELNTTEEPDNTEQLQLQSDNIVSLKSPGVLIKHSARLPKVILDTMDLTTALGKRYLWVDRLCIIQDGPKKKAEIDRMDQIYHGAYATIAAAATYGLYRSRGGTLHDFVFKEPCHCDRNGPLFRLCYQERCYCNWKQEMLNTNPSTMRISMYYKNLSATRWARRAWTYQEQILSKRVIFFLDTSVFWQCERAVWDLDILRPQQDHGDLATMTAMSNLSNPLPTTTSSDFNLYIDLICPYNGRELSYKEDGLYACSGILNRLSPAFPQGFLFGLPRLYLDYALLWQPLHGCYKEWKCWTEFSWTEDIEPFDGGHERTSLVIRRPSLPSWAWCGWQCFIDPQSFHPTSDLILGGRKRLQPIVTWELAVPSRRPGDFASSWVSLKSNPS